MYSQSGTLNRIALVSFLSATALFGVVPTPTGYWSFNSADVSGTTAFDRSGNNMNGVINSAAQTPGRIGQALSFNGSSSDVMITNDGSLTQLTSDLTIATWIRTSNATRYEAVISKYDAGGYETGYILQTTPAGTLALRLGLNNLGSGARETYDTTRIDDGQWHHVAVVMTLGQDIKFYVDGVLSSAWPTNILAASAAASMLFGYDFYSPYGDYFTGSLDEVYLFRQALAADQIQALYGGGGAGAGPVISNVQTSNIATKTATITWNTDTPADTQVDYGATISYGQSSALDTSLVLTHTANLTGLTASTQYHFRVKSRSNTGILTNSSDATFTTPSPVSAGPAVMDTTAADFSAGSGANTYVAQFDDGEVTLAPAFGTEWSGNALPGGWSTTIWQNGGSATVANGVLTLSAAMVSGPLYGPGRSVEFVATFTADPDEHIGFAVDLLSAPWAIFSTQANRAINIRTNNGTNFINQLISGAYIGSPHRYRIDWTSTGFTYWIDGTQVGTHQVPISDRLRPVVSNNFIVNGLLTSDWLHLTPYVSSATFTSHVLDAGTTVRWSSGNWTADIPFNTSLALSVRMGNTPVPDGTWTGFTPVSSPGGVISGNSRYIQYQAMLASADPSQTVVLRDVTLQYNGALSNIQATNINTTSATITWTSSTAADSQVDYGMTNSYGLSSPLDTTKVTRHSVNLSNLSANSTYHFHVKSNDGSGVVVSGDYTFMTPSTPDTTPPMVAVTAPSAGQTVVGKVSLTATASDNVGVAGLQFQIDAANFGAELTSPPYSTTLDSTALSNGSHSISAVARDAAGNRTTATAVNVTVANPTTRSLADTTAADFGAGTGTNTYISLTTDGEVMQAPALATEFSTVVPGFTVTPWAAGGGISVSNGNLNVDGALYASNNYFAGGRSLEFTATFSGDASQHLGFGTDLQGPPWAIISTYGGGGLYARTNNGSQSLVTALPGAYIGAPHRFRIDWAATGLVYWIDGVQIVSHAAPVSANMRPLLSDGSVGGGKIVVDWLRMSPYASPATFVSRVMDAGSQALWGALTWTADLPAGTSLAMSARTGNTAVPDASWTAFNSINSSGTNIGGSSRYVQYRAALSSTDLTQSVALRDVTVQYDTSISNIQATNITTNGATITWTTSAPSSSQVDYGTTTAYGVSSPIDSSLVTSHSVALSGLQSSTIYHYRVKSKDGNNILTVSGDFTFTTNAIPDNTPPTITMTAPTDATTVSGTVTVSANASDNVGVARVQFLLDGGSLGAELTSAPYSINWDSTTGSNGNHVLSAIARDFAGNLATAPGVTVNVANTIVRTLTDTTAANFSLGSGTNTYISLTGDGEVIQAPALGAEFTSFPSGWTVAPWTAGGGGTINNGAVTVDGALLSSNSLYGSGRSLEFVATFSGDTSQHAGLGTDLQGAPWAIFSTYGGGTTLYVRTNTGTQSSVAVIPGNYFGAPHRYRIDWTASGFVYWIDGVQVLTDALPVNTAMRPVVSDAAPGNGAVVVDWMRLTPYASSATFISRVLDGGMAVNWSTLLWTATLPAGTTIALSFRTGNTPIPDASWTGFTPVNSSGGTIGRNSRYLQYQAQFTSSDPSQTAVLNDVTVSYTP